MTAEIVNNGSRVELPFAIGPAGLVKKGDTAQISFVPKGREQPRAGATLEIEGEAFKVVAIGRSKSVAMMTTISLVRMEADG